MRFKELPEAARHTFYYDLTAGMLFGVFGGLLLPFILIVGRKIGASDFQIALLSATPYIANAFTLLWTEDVFGKGRVWYVVWPGVLGRSLLFLMLFITSPGPYTAVIFFYMLITAIPFPSYAAIMKTNYPDEVRGRLMSYVRGGNAVFWIASSVIGGVILERSTYNYRYLFPFAAVFGVLSALRFRQVRISLDEKADFRKAYSRLSSAFKDRAFRKFLMTYTLFEAGILVALPVYPLYLVDYVHISNLAAGLFGSVFSFMWLTGALFWGQFMDRHTVKSALIPVFLVSSITPIIYFSTKDIYLLASAQAVWGAVFAATELLGYLVITKMAPSGKVPYYMAANIALGGLRGAVIPFIGTYIYSSAGPKAVFAIAVILAFSSLLSSVRFLEKD